MKEIKRILAVLLAVIIVTTCLPQNILQVSATTQKATTNTTEEVPEGEVPEEEVPEGEVPEEEVPEGEVPEEEVPEGEVPEEEVPEGEVPEEEVPEEEVPEGEVPEEEVTEEEIVIEEIETTEEPKDMMEKNSIKEKNSYTVESASEIIKSRIGYALETYQGSIDITDLNILNTQENGDQLTDLYSNYLIENPQYFWMLEYGGTDPTKDQLYIGKLTFGARGEYYDRGVMNIPKIKTDR